MFCTIRKFFKQPTQPVYLVNICAVKISACKQCKRIDPNLFYVSTKEILEVNAALGQHRFRNAVPHGLKPRINCCLDHFFGLPPLLPLRESLPTAIRMSLKRVPRLNICFHSSAWSGVSTSASVIHVRGRPGFPGACNSIRQRSTVLRR